jgi:hypothetical protein
MGLLLWEIKALVAKIDGEGGTPPIATPLITTSNKYRSSPQSRAGHQYLQLPILLTIPSTKDGPQNADKTMNIASAMAYCTGFHAHHHGLFPLLFTRLFDDAGCLCRHFHQHLFAVSTASLMLNRFSCASSWFVSVVFH